MPCRVDETAVEPNHERESFQGSHRGGSSATGVRDGSGNNGASPGTALAGMPPPAGRQAVMFNVRRRSRGSLLQGFPRDFRRWSVDDLRCERQDFTWTSTKLEDHQFDGVYDGAYG